ncbi:hypothetical protein RRG08_064647 [Elysia crispata]|uniref:Uncharacterized protein n=1 Tax=Elysia crispata TaxID=231223 RepID=A0AAE1B9U2_9GAST|nr:hypothetical protein RRG08_064647 [Elysia crispata]
MYTVRPTSGVKCSQSDYPRTKETCLVSVEDSKGTPSNVHLRRCVDTAGQHVPQHVPRMSDKLVVYCRRRQATVTGSWYRQDHAGLATRYLSLLGPSDRPFDY